MRLVQPRKSVSQSQRPSLGGESYDLPLRAESGSAVIEDWDTALRSNDGALADVGWQELGSQSSETVLVTVRFVYFLLFRNLPILTLLLSEFDRSPRHNRMMQTPGLPRSMLGTLYHVQFVWQMEREKNGPSVRIVTIQSSLPS
jgi:hypothetical protein